MLWKIHKHDICADSELFCIIIFGVILPYDDAIAAIDNVIELLLLMLLVL